MKALTVWQPYADLIVRGWKPFEFRTWDYRRRAPKLEGERIVIHAAARPMKADEIMEMRDRMFETPPAFALEAGPLLERILDAHKCQGVMELAAGVGTAVLGTPRLCTEIWPMHADAIDPEMWAWPMEHVEQWDEPQPRRGAQGFWNW